MVKRDIFPRATWLEPLTQDLRHAARSLLHTPAFAFAAAISLALGIAAGSTVFSIADTIFLRPLPYPDAGRLVWTAIRFPSSKAEFLPSPDYVAWRRDNRVFEQLAATQASGPGTMILNYPQAAEVHVARVSFNFLSTLGIAPWTGRAFTPQEELPNGPKAVLLTYSFWQEHFGARKAVAGQRMTLDGQAYTVAGVLPASFRFPMDAKVELLTTLAVALNASHRDRDMATWAVIGRLKPGVTLAQAQANVDTLFAASRADFPIMFRSDTRAVVESLQQHRVGNARELLLVLIGAVSCLLLLACANVANLLLARWAVRSRELAIRAAIGAARGRLVRQLLAEALLLTAIGFGAGVLLLFGTLRAFVHFAAGELPRLDELAVDGRVLAIAALVSLATTLFFGVLPAMRAGRVDVQSALQRAGRPGIAGGFRFLRRVLVSSEVALSFVLLSGAALLIQTLWHLENDHLGFEPEHVLTIAIPLSPALRSDSHREALARELLASIRRVPGTEAASAGECSPLSAGSMSLTFSRSDRPLPEAFHRGDAIGACGAGLEYFQAAGTPLMRGRSLSERDFDHPDSLAVINEAAARAYFPGEDPLGKRIGGTGGQPWKTVVGVAADTKNAGLNQPTVPQMFVNARALYAGSDLFLLVRHIGDAQAIAPVVRSTLRSIDPALYAKFETLDETIAQQTSAPRFNSVLLGSFAAIAFLMTMIGVYGVLAFSVAQRVQEIGIRLALGAESAQILALVLKEGAVLATAGILSGVAVTLFTAASLKSLVYGVGVLNPFTYGAVVLTLAIAALAASYLPARRAARVDPVISLRHE